MFYRQVYAHYHYKEPQAIAKELKHTLFLIAWATLALSAFCCAKQARAEPSDEPKGNQPSIDWVGVGTSFQTPVFKFEGEKSGPIVLIQAGIHGDEVAGIIALNIFSKALRVRAGTVLLIPCMNQPACSARKRFINVDLNRTFLDEKRISPYEFKLAKELSELVEREGVTHMLTLHEASKLHDPGRKFGLGQTICYGVSPKPQILQSWLTKLNAKLLTREELFSSVFYPIPTSSTEVLVQRHSLAGGFCIETWTGFEERRRVQMQIAAVESFLEAVGTQFNIEMRCGFWQTQSRRLLRYTLTPGWVSRYYDCGKYSWTWRWNYQRNSLE